MVRKGGTAAGVNHIMTDKLLAKRAAKKVATGLAMTETVRNYFLKNKDVTMKADKCECTLTVRGKYVDGDVYVEKVPLLPTKDELFAYVQSHQKDSPDEQRARLCILWNSVKQFGSVEAMKRRVSPDAIGSTSTFAFAAAASGMRATTRTTVESRRAHQEAHAVVLAETARVEEAAMKLQRQQDARQWKEDERRREEAQIQRQHALERQKQQDARQREFDLTPVVLDDLELERSFTDNVCEDFVIAYIVKDRPTGHGIFYDFGCNVFEWQSLYACETRKRFPDVQTAIEYGKQEHKKREEDSRYQNARARGFM